MPAGPTPSTHRRFRGVLAQVVLVGILGVIAAVIVGAVSVYNVSRMRDTDEQLGRLQSLSDEVQAIRFGNTDTNGWQAFYAWDTRTKGQVEALEVTDDSNRGGFERAVDVAAATIRELSDAEQLRVWSGTARAWYPALERTISGQ